MGHVRMMAAVQPFMSGAISKTVNLTKESTVEDIGEIYMNAYGGSVVQSQRLRNGVFASADRFADLGETQPPQV